MALKKQPIDSQQQSNQKLAKETRAIVTPYAFHVAPELIGTPLATPFKRGVAISIDAIMLGLLTQASSFILAGIAAATFFRAGNRLKKKEHFHKTRISLRFLTAILLFIFVLGVMKEINIDGQVPSDAESITAVEGLENLAIMGEYIIRIGNINDRIIDSECQNRVHCWEQIIADLVDDMSVSELDTKQIMVIFNVLLEVDENDLTEQQSQSLRQKFKVQYQSQTGKTLALDSSINSYLGDPINSENIKPEKVGLISWFKNILEALGLGFGWAAFYFSVFTAWWNGQTIGKKLLGIKVLKLDNSDLNLWESFGRYGGYGAGFATGLLGFLQLFWDPNRQAIQDKISETLVIDIRKTKQPFELNKE